jgi:hypothetical protein
MPSNQVLISLLLFVDNLVLLASTPEGLHRKIDALAIFCDLRQLMFNLGKTKVLIFNAYISTTEGQRMRSPQPTLIWEYSSWGHVSVCCKPFSLDSVKGMAP